MSALILRSSRDDGLAATADAKIIAAGGWRPIHRAPHSGQIIQVMTLGRHTSEICRAKWINGEWRERWIGEVVHPTHWRPDVSVSWKMSDG